MTSVFARSSTFWVLSIGVLFAHLIDLLSTYAVSPDLWGEAGVGFLLLGGGSGKWGLLVTPKCLSQ